MLAAFPALLKESLRSDIYRLYMSEVGRYTAESTARLSGGGYLQSRYEDIVAFRPEETRTEEEIIARVRQALGG